MDSKAQAGPFYYPYEAIVKKWLAYLIWKGVPKAYANAFLKQPALIKGSQYAKSGDAWSGTHTFYDGTLSKSNERNLHFIDSDIESLLDLILASHPSLDRKLLYPNPTRRHAQSEFSLLSPISFKTVDALQANRAGLKLTHNASLLAQNRRKFTKFQERGKGAVLAIDVESWERNHDILIEVGWAYIHWSKGEEDGRVKEVKQCEHLIIKDYRGYRNGQYSADNREHFNFGHSITLTLSAVLTKLSSLISSFRSTGPLILVFHNASAEIEYFSTLGIETKAWIQGFPAVAIEEVSSEEEALDVTLKDGEVYVMDTQKLFAASGMQEAIPQIKLSKALDALGIPNRYLHNAGNDACYTLAVYEALVGPGAIRDDLVAEEAQRQEELKKRRNGNGWSSGWD